MYQRLVYNCVFLFPLAQKRELLQLPQLSAMAFKAGFLTAHWAAAAFARLEVELKEIKALVRDLVALKATKAIALFCTC